MIDLDVSVNIFLLAALLGLSVCIGFLLKKGKIAKKNGQLMKLEDEKLEAHAEILQLQKEIGALESMIKDPSSPVIAMKTGIKEEDTALTGKKPPDNSPNGKNKQNRTA